MKLPNALPQEQLHGRRVFVYKNLHQGCWSIKDRQTGHVVAHADRVELSDVELKVSQAGRRRVLEEQRKNVHAGVVGTLEGVRLSGYPSRRYVHGQAGQTSGQPQLVTYNPYKYSSFVNKADETPVRTAERAILDADGKSVWVFSPNA
ncbi:MAG: hypothetical protein KF760_10190 [Candidatus Eremiobacteraeota bacterium]|nr:hypothetical protein [Candidatus Eremiobacteraeota bacterium]MCW5867699.1 hypothetical protein [Candidatus Eremiobacteraeota bacterium]